MADADHASKQTVWPPIGAGQTCATRRLLLRKLEIGDHAMNRFRLFLASSAITLTALPVFAQQGPGPGGPGPMYGYGHMWGGGWHLGVVFAPFVMLLALIGTVALIVWLVRSFSHGGYHGPGGCPFCGHHRGRAALEILEERLAKGEIGKDEFEEKRKLLGR